jgi:hypothetical protein
VAFECHRAFVDEVAALFPAGMRVETATDLSGQPRFVYGWSAG